MMSTLHTMIEREREREKMIRYLCDTDTYLHHNIDGVEDKLLGQVQYFDE